MIERLSTSCRFQPSPMRLSSMTIPSFSWTPVEDAGFRVLEADDGDHAKRMLEEHGSSITLLFSDVEMPGETDGFALARHAAQRWPEIAIVISSGRLKPEADDMPKGATFIGKPFGESVVHDHLRKILPDGKKPELLKEAVS